LSEAVLVGLILSGDQPIVLLLVVATLGNVLGSVANWLLGRFMEHFRDRSWFPVSPASLGRAEAWYQRFGIWSLLLSWVPIIGDPLTVVAGVLRTPFLTFLILVTIAKAGRYAVLAALTLQMAG
jgi:membrane protein YqaA with SNARE-associated domain